MHERHDHSTSFGNGKGDKTTLSPYGQERKALILLFYIPK